ncbi:MAG TPA: crossover junction endodeoxyribonuclease RuvC [Methylomirabilota bacterium]|nr:crossover junction endodeoxyribonuclease RuvC [Methylomirabilota bacterium]
MARPSQPGNHRPKGSAWKIIGIDPGTVVTGWGVIEARGSTLAHLGHGTIATTGANGQGDRLSRIYRGIQEVIESYRPDGLSLERVFFARNAQSALKLGQARGVALLAAAHNGIVVHEYAASEIKLAVVGYGQATKEQVQKMVASLLRLSEKMAPDASDALATAICHLHRQRFQSLILRGEPDWSASMRRRRWSAAAVKKIAGRV